MNRFDRRRFLAAAAAFAATPAWARPESRPSRRATTERRDFFPEGVASGDPDWQSVIQWTRRPFAARSGHHELTVEVARDPTFREVIAEATAPVSPETDWTTRVPVAGLQPSTEYWYRFVDGDHNTSRLGRTVTAPSDDDPRPVAFAFVSCQNLTGAPRTPIGG
jgi:alkaline phosphatase D